ncbi:MAG TPA: hypothetical protein VFG15_06350 [Amycolatopsis sp.]|nr:hypothetical protein [Amycolatopsis sp.]
MAIKGIAHFQIVAPLDTHWRAGTCEEDNCVYFLEGWQTVCDETTELDQLRAAYIRNDKSRRHTETRESPTRTVFRFEAGQQCFQQHRIPLGRPELYLVQGEQGAPSMVHSGPDAWLDDFRTNQSRLDRIING